MSVLPSQRLDGQHALVTGAGRGIGLACALALVELGATVTAVARTARDLDDLAAECGAEPVVADVTDEADVDRAVAVAAAHPGFAICVNAAGTNRPGATAEQPVADFDTVMAANVRGAYLVSRAVGRELLRRERPGRIVHLGSQMGSVGYPGRAAYCASKHAVEGLTKALAVEWAPHGITVNTVAPTFIETPLTAPMLADPAFRADVLARIPLGRIGTVADVVGAVAFLVSAQAALVTGHTLAVDGGWTAW